MRTDQPRTVPGHRRSELWSLREDVNLEMEPDEGPVRLRGRWGDIVVQEPSPLVREALGRMRLGPVSLENAISGLAPPAGQPPADGQSAGAPPADAQRTELQLVFDRLQPLIIRSLGLASGQPLLSVVPLTVHSRFVPEPLDP